MAPDDEVRRAAAALGRLGGRKGGPGRAASLTPAERHRIAHQAGCARWGRAPAPAATPPPHPAPAPAFDVERDCPPPRLDRR